jgi:hypothetical protein
MLAESQPDCHVARAQRLGPGPGQGRAAQHRRQPSPSPRDSDSTAALLRKGCGTHRGYPPQIPRLAGFHARFDGNKDLRGTDNFGCETRGVGGRIASVKFCQGLPRHAASRSGAAASRRSASIMARIAAGLPKRIVEPGLSCSFQVCGAIPWWQWSRTICGLATKRNNNEISTNYSDFRQQW